MVSVCGIAVSPLLCYSSCWFSLFFIWCTLQHYISLWNSCLPSTLHVGFHSSSPGVHYNTTSVCGIAVSPLLCMLVFTLLHLVYITTRHQSVEQLSPLYSACWFSLFFTWCTLQHDISLWNSCLPSTLYVGFHSSSLVYITTLHQSVE